jgi:hypothetical protein
MKEFIFVVACSIILASCAIGTAGHGPEWVGQPASALVNREGMPERQMTAPSGATVYIYPRRSLDGINILCNEQYFVQGDAVIGFEEHGVAIGCSRAAGTTM